MRVDHVRCMLSVMDRSVLELRVGGLPFPHGGTDGVWRYRHAVRPEGPTAMDSQTVADFIAYEADYGRPVHVIAEDALSDWQTWGVPRARPHLGAFAVQCCSHAYTDGCTARLVCHGAPAAAAARILANGTLRSATTATGRAATELAAASTWGEPADYFEHVMLANGRCTAPEAVSYSRLLGRDLVPADLGPGYPPAVRFYFDWETLATHPDARFDGVHPVKIHTGLRLDDVPFSVVVHADQRHLVTAAAGRFRERLAVLDIQRPSPQDWATAAVTAASQLA
jgi:hypothetical protein